MNKFCEAGESMVKYFYDQKSPKNKAEYDYVIRKENINPYKKLSGQWNQYENWFLNAKLREEGKDE